MMALFDRLFGNRRELEALSYSLRENVRQLSILGDTLQRGFDTSRVETGLSTTARHLQTLSAVLAQSASRPIPVQTFPTADDLRFEAEKTKLTRSVALHLAGVGGRFLTSLADAPKPVDRAMTAFFDQLEGCRKKRTSLNQAVLKEALEGLIHCSPKRVVASFQEHSLQAGWACVSAFNRVVDELAARYPRCRAGIFASRLNYADVLQVSEEILATLRATSTVLEDLQRRHDMLDALQGELRSDLDTTEISKIWEAIFASFKDTLSLGDDGGGWVGTVLKKTAGLAGSPVAWALGVLAAPNAQFQGQLAREQRVRVFLATSLLMQQGWREWSALNAAIVRPHLEIMFALKSDFAANRVLVICDLITANGYELEGAAQRVGKLLEPAEKNKG